jgi:hypothetical protein
MFDIGLYLLLRSGAEATATPAGMRGIDFEGMPETV